MTLDLHPLNSLAFVISIKIMNASGKLEPLSEGTVTAFLSTSSSPTASAADGSLSVSAVYTGSRGEWSVRFPASILTPALLNALFASTAPFCIVVASEGLRGAIPLKYDPTLLLDVK